MSQNILFKVCLVCDERKDAVDFNESTTPGVRRRECRECQTRIQRHRREQKIEDSGNNNELLRRWRTVL